MVTAIMTWSAIRASVASMPTQTPTKLAPRLRELLSEEDYPLFTHFIHHDHGLPDKNAEFEASLQTLLDGDEMRVRAATEKFDTTMSFLLGVG